MSKWLLSGLLLLAPLAGLYAQTVARYDSGFTYREVDPSICSDPQHLCHFYKSVSWDDSKFAEYTYRGMNGSYVVEFMNWRMLFPPGYSKKNSSKYPMIIMLHGAGESGRAWTGHFEYKSTDVQYDNNGANILWGGPEHLNAVNRPSTDSKSFPGIVVWPQASYNGGWEGGWNNGQLADNNRMASKIVEYMISNFNVDQDRVYIHGLSNGARGVWDLASKRPDLFAAVLVMSGIGNNPDAMTDTLVTMPFWQFQGGLDINPNPSAAQQGIDLFKQKGANPRYYLYPDLGHNTWQYSYADPDFLSWIL